ncbi:ABC transporter G family member 29 isoform X2 [Physcomitrium patens]|nr:ABC transporter G family member 29-like isoform X2 [Physcomitrium patens]|eukprot:XP_024394096.1 ABC transporter G family member 29-like isoform X2 [Physcomitrella patens]
MSGSMSRSTRESLSNYPTAFGANPLESALRQSNHAYDEEALRWAALEKLPTYDRLRTSVFQKHSGSVRQVDVKDLSKEDFRHLLQKAQRNADAEDEQLIVKLRKRLDMVGIDLPTIEVRYENLSIKANCYVGNRGLPTLWNTLLNIVEGILDVLHLATSKKKVITILDNVSGVIKPGRMTLLLGPPSSGKTTLMLALAGKLDSSLKVKGSVTFNGHTHKEFVPQKTAMYVSQNDLHNGQLTVRETLDFSARVQGVGTQYHILEEVVKREKEAGIRPEPDVDTFMKAAALPSSNGSLAVEYVLNMLGLDVCADTMVGDQMRRGISGGEKKRVTTGEMIVGPTKVLFMDEISTGLDSSTTFSIVKSLSRFTHSMSGTVFISLLQPAPETFNLFDDVLLISEGQVVYHGPIGNVEEFFESCGFKSPERKGIADFLQEVTSRKDQEQYWAHKQKPYRYVSVKEFADAFHSFHVGVKMKEDLSVPYPREKSHPAALAKEKYSIGKFELLKACFQRERVLAKRNAIVNIVKAVQITVGAFISMTTFFRTRLNQDTLNDGILYLNVLFFAIVIFFFTGFNELAGTIGRLPVLIKQRDMLLSPAWAYSISAMILSIPSSLVEVGIYTSMTYFVTGYAPDAGRFFKQYLVLFLIQQQAGGMFRFVAGLCRTDTLAFTLGWIMILLLFMLGGFIIPRPSIPVWWRWAYWATNMAYAEQAISVNELLAPRWRKPSPGDATTELGVAVLQSRGLFPYSYWYWIGVGGLFGFYVLFNLGFTLTLGYMPAIGKKQTIMSEQELAEKEATTTGIGLPKSASRSRSRSRKSIDLKSISAAMIRAEEAPTTLSRSRRSSKNHAEIENKAAEDEDKVVRRGMILPFQPLSISFDDVCYYVDMPAEMKSAEVTESKLKLLSGITGAFRPGVLTALVGVSGAGKTTLMDVLAGRKTGGYIEGDIRISGYPKKQKTFARISGYCEQNDIHSPQTTVREALIYSAWLRLNTEVDDASKMAFVDEVLDLVELTPLENALVGLPGITGLSTEQRKRLTIAVELVANPSIIFMDEPTSGLDARAAAIVMRTVRNTVDTGRTVVCTIHQPSIDIFEAFDELLLLKRGGRVIYAGPLGHQSSKLVEYFQAIPGITRIKDGYNPATWMLEVSNVDTEIQLGVDFADLYLKSSLYQRNKQLVEELKVPAPGSKDLYFPTEYPRSFRGQVGCTLWKQNISYWRSPNYNLVRYGFTFFTALICGSIFWGVGQKYDTLEELTTTIGALYGATLFLCFNNAQTVQPMVSIERTVHYREKAAGMYSATSYALAQVLVEIPYVLVQAAMYSSITYSMLAFIWTPAKFFWYFYTQCIGLVTFTYYGMMMVAITPNLILATVLSTFFYTVFNLYSGFLIPRPYIPGWWIWYYWFCPVAYSVYALLASQYGDVTDRLNVTGSQPTTVNVYLDQQFGFNHDYLKFVGPILFLWAILFGGVFVFAIKYLNFQRR